MTKRILFSLSNFGTKNSEYLKKVIANFLSYKKYKVDIHIFTTVSLNLNNITEYLYPQSIGRRLHHETIYKVLNSYKEYDILVHTENDLYISEDTIRYWEETNKKLSPNKVCGLLRFEQRDNDYVFPDHQYNENIELVEHNNEKYFALGNVCQGCSIHYSEQIELLQDLTFGPELEDAVSACFYSTQWPGTTKGLKKLYPINFEKLLVHHMPNKYQTIYPNLLTLNDLQNKLICK